MKTLAIISIITVILMTQMTSCSSKGTVTSIQENSNNLCTYEIKPFISFTNMYFYKIDSCHKYQLGDTTDF